MKLRIKGDSIRFRLSKSELTAFGIVNFVKDKIHFADSELEYAISMSDSIAEISASFQSNLITVNVPTQLALNWVNTEIVGLQFEQTLSNGNKLFILIEKDFVCLDNTFEDQSDNFPNPNIVC